MRACVICAFKGSRLERCFRESWRFCWRKEFGICAERSFLHEVTLVNTHMKAQKYNQVSQMLVSKLVPQVDPHVKMGSAKVSRKKTRKDYTFSLKLAKSQKGNFEQPPCISRNENSKMPTFRDPEDIFRDPKDKGPYSGLERKCFEKRPSTTA